MLNYNYQGKHIFFDFVNFNSSKTDEEKANIIFDIMINAINDKTDMKIVHKKLVVFDSKFTDPGFTSVLLLDASHFTAHSYTDERSLLAMDLFTCGKTNTDEVASYVISEIQNIFTEIKLSKYVVNNRFRLK